MVQDKVVLVTGGTGSFGKVFVRRALEGGAKKVIVFSRDEFKQSEMAKEFALQYEDARVEDTRIRYMLGDVRDVDRLRRVFRGVDIVVHAAALKQVPALEYNPTEAVRTNVNGATNIVEAALDTPGLTHVVALSTDKAVNPVNLYGATKLCAEKIFTAANAFCGPKFSCVRYGNVIGSRGSVIPLFQKLKDDGITEFPVTSRDMTRFWITLDKAVEFVLKTLDSMQGGEIFIPRIPSMTILDVARAIDENCTFKEIGVRPGEKLHEILVSEDCSNTYFLEKDGPVRALPGYASNANQHWLTPDELRDLL
jgi:UDP-N-acetylglucosamine 4,6-dehydratase